MTAAWSFQDHRKWTWLCGPWRFVFSPLWLRRAVSADVLVVHAALPSCDVQFVDKVSVLVSVRLYRCVTSLWASFAPLFFTASMHSSLSSDLWFLWLVQVQLCKPKLSCLAAPPTRLYFSIHSFPATCVWVVGAAVSRGSLTHSQELWSVRSVLGPPSVRHASNAQQEPKPPRCGAVVQVGAPHPNSRRGFNLFLVSCHELWPSPC